MKGGMEMDSKIFKVIVEAIIEPLISKETFFKTPRQMEQLLKKEIIKKSKELGIKRGSLKEEMDSLRQLANAIAKRDQRIFDEYHHLIMTGMVSIGGFARRLNREAKRAGRGLQKVQTILTSLAKASQEEIDKDTAIIFKEAKRLSKRVKRVGKSRPHL